MSEPSSSAQAVVVIEKRSPDGRRRPYIILRVMAKCATVIAPLIALVMLYNAVVAWFIEETLFAKIITSLEFALKAGAAYIILTGAAQMIYLVFDIARDTAALRGERLG